MMVGGPRGIEEAVARAAVHVDPVPHAARREHRAELLDVGKRDQRIDFRELPEIRYLDQVRQLGGQERLDRLSLESKAAVEVDDARDVLAHRPEVMREASAETESPRHQRARLEPEVALRGGPRNGAQI